MAVLTDQQLLQANIITALNLQGLPDGRKVQLLQRVATLVQKAVQLRILKLLSSDDLQMFNTFVAEKGEDSPETVDFIKAKIPNLAELFEEEIVNAKRNLITNIGGVSI